MESPLPVGWAQDSHTLYLHESGVRIERRVYRNKEGWVLVPVDLDRTVMEFAPNSEGLGQAFAAFAEGVLEPKDPASTEARKGARDDEKLERSSDDEETEKEKEDEDDG